MASRGQWALRLLVVLLPTWAAGSLAASEERPSTSATPGAERAGIQHNSFRFRPRTGAGVPQFAGGLESADAGRREAEAVHPRARKPGARRVDVNAQREHKRPGPTSDQAPHQAPRSKLSAAAARVDPNVTGTASEAKDVKTVDAVPGASLAQDVPNTNPEPGVEGDLIVMEEEKSQKRIVPGPVADVNGSQAPSLDEELAKAMPVLELQRMPSFYMYDPGFSTKQLLQCLLEAPNRFQTSKKADAALDRDVFDRLQDEAKRWFSADEHSKKVDLDRSVLQHVLPEIYLTEALAQHDRRVQDPAEASLFVMPSLTHVSWMLGDFDCCRQQQANPNCNWGRHQDRGMLMWRIMTRDESPWLAFPTRHLFVTTAYAWSEHFHPRMWDLMLRSTPVVTVLDKFVAAHHLRRAYGPEDVAERRLSNKMLAAGVVIPLYAHHQLVMTGACENQSIASRTTYVYFWQDIHPKPEWYEYSSTQDDNLDWHTQIDLKQLHQRFSSKPAPSLRSHALHTLAGFVENSKVVWTGSKQDSDDGLVASTNYMQFNSPRFAHELPKASLCMAVAGVHVTTRMLYDAIAAECVPVIVSDQICDSLPFTALLNYSDFALFLPEGLMRQGGMAASQYLRDLLQNERGPEVLNAMMDRVRAVRPWMHYGCNNPVGEQPRFGLAASALLAQIHFHPHLRDGIGANASEPELAPVYSSARCLLRNMLGPADALQPASDVAVLKRKHTQVAIHQTAITANPLVEGVLYRFATTNGLRVYQTPLHAANLPIVPLVFPEMSGRWSVHLGHVYPLPSLMYQQSVPAGGWENVISAYEAVLGKDAMVLVVLNNPLDYYIDWFQAMKPASSAVTLADYLASPNRTTNPLAAQFGIYSKAEAEEFLVAGHLARMRPLLANDLERGLAALASEAGWEITDVLHIPTIRQRDRAMFAQVRAEAERLSSLDQEVPEELKTLAAFVDSQGELMEGNTHGLSANAMRSIEESIELDRILYQAASEAYHGWMAHVAATDPSLDQKVAALQVLQQSVWRHCGRVSVESTKSEIYIPVESPALACRAMKMNPTEWQGVQFLKGGFSGKPFSASLRTLHRHIVQNMGPLPTEDDFLRMAISYTQQRYFKAHGNSTTKRDVRGRNQNMAVEENDRRL